MKAIILAAGVSSRLYPLTLKNPKCLLELEPGKTIIEHQIDVLQRCGIKNILVVTGYLKDHIKNYLKDKVRYRDFDDFAKYNNMHTLYSIKDELNDDVVILFSDVVFGEKVLRKCAESNEDFSLLVHNKKVLSDTMRVKIKDGSIVDIGGHILPEQGDGNFIGVGKFSKKGAELLIEKMERMIDDPKHDNDYYTIPLVEVAKEHKVSFEFVEDEPWIEIDFLEHYNKAKDEIYPLVK
jgi:choline kinase|tara:strand:- start:277 stop:987 length:711 start_codon:yes stop_codon:yes gene_type:complete